MAYDDMEVVMYKILSYLYLCNKEEKHPEFADYCAGGVLIKTKPMYWNQIMLELIDMNLVKGFKVNTKDGISIVPVQPMITFKGVSFLQENSRMSKAREFLGDAFETVLTVTVSALISRV